ncbi:Citrate synthase [Mycena sanguinolenta]|uniref:Citrate synthase n=1 Tax=Mycena sanguinolenta TaxID=230812 RepID=A0A8H7DL89_9AGAR|nr:Citrate synthase [Mycena sanguinolenta]
MNGIASSGNGAAPSVNGTAPNGTVPTANGIAPQVNGTAPQVDGLANGVNGIALNGTSSSLDGSPQTIFDAIATRIPSRAALAAKLMMKYRDSTVHEVTVENIMGGMRGLPCMLWEISESDATGVRHHKQSLSELEASLPKWPGSTQMSPEAMLWFLYTAQIPTSAELQGFAAELARRAELPSDALAFIDTLPKNISADSQNIMIYTFLGKYSKFNAALARGISKDDLWKHALEDALDVIARSPVIVAAVYAKANGIAQNAVPFSPAFDMAHNFARYIGKEGDNDFIEFTRLCWAFYLDHGASVSSHGMRLASSSWADPYSSLAAGYIGATGPLHAKAIGDSVKFNLKALAALGSDPSRDEIIAYIGNYISEKKIIPGYGHALLRVRDARLEILRRFLDEHPSSDPQARSLLSLIRNMNECVPELLRERVPGMKNPHPNCDTLNGCILHAYGYPSDQLMLFFACSRAMGFMTQYVWDRALGLPIERPLSVTMDELLAKVQS